MAASTGRFWRRICSPQHHARGSFEVIKPTYVSLMKKALPQSLFHQAKSRFWFSKIFSEKITFRHKASSDLMRGQQEWRDRNTERKVWNLAKFQVVQRREKIGRIRRKRKVTGLEETKRKAKRKKQARKDGRDGFSVDQRKAASAVFPAGAPYLIRAAWDCPLSLKLLGSSMALLLGKLLMLPFSGRRWTPLFRLFWPVFFSFCFPFLSLPNLSPSSSFEFFRSFPFSVPLGTLPSSIPSFLYFYLFIPAVLSLDPMKPYGETLSFHQANVGSSDAWAGATQSQNLPGICGPIRNLLVLKWCSYQHIWLQPALTIKLSQM